MNLRMNARGALRSILRRILKGSQARPYTLAELIKEGRRLGYTPTDVREVLNEFHRWGQVEYRPELGGVLVCWLEANE